MGLDGEEEFYVQEAGSFGSPALELGCGTGRILIPVAEAAVEVVGLDQEPAMLAVARQKIGRLSPAVRQRIAIVEGYKIDALHGDFRRGPFRSGGEPVWIAQRGR